MPGWRLTGGSGLSADARRVDFSPNFDQHYWLESGNKYFILPIHELTREEVKAAIDVAVRKLAATAVRERK